MKGDQEILRVARQIERQMQRIYVPPIRAYYERRERRIVKAFLLTLEAVGHLTKEIGRLQRAVGGGR